MKSVFVSPRLATPVLLAFCTLACNSKSGGGSNPGGTVLTTLDFQACQELEFGVAGLGQGIVQDLNGDGIQDIAVVSWPALSVFVEMGDAKGGYTLAPVLPTPSSPLVIAAGDVSGDGRKDLVVGCVDQGGTGIPNITVYDQDPQGVYVDGYSIDLPYRPTSIALGSPLGAAQLDIFVALEEERAVWQFRVVAAHAIQFVQSIDSSAIGDGAPVTVALQDVDGDGFLDLAAGERAVSGGEPDRVVLYPNDFAGSFGDPSVIVPIAAWPAVLAVDADGDAYGDLAVAQLEDDHVLVMHGSAAGPTLPAQSVDFRGPSFNAAFGDFDDDGLYDIAAPIYTQGAIGVRLASAPGVYEPPKYFNAGNGAHALSAALLPGDGRLDLVCSNFASVSILRGKKSGSFDSMFGFTVGDRPQYVLCTDFDGDGNPDTCSVDQYQQDVVFLRGLGNGQFEYVAAVPLSPTTVETPGYLIEGDFDEDGLPDVMASVLEDSAVQLMRNDGSLPLISLRVDRIDVGDVPLGLSSGLLNADDHLDVVVCNSADDTMQVLFGNGDGTFQTQLAIPVGDQSLTVQCADLDNDGFTDVALCTGEFSGANSKLSLWRGDGQGHLALASQQPLPEVALVIGLGDFNLDGLSDLTLSQPGYPADDVFVMTNLGSFQFASQRVQVGPNPGTLQVADVNRDGIDDVIVPLGTGRLRVLLGNGKGSFQTTFPDFAVDLPSPFAVNASAWKDVNHDGLPDLLLVSPESIHMWVSLNQSR